MEMAITNKSEIITLESLEAQAEMFSRGAAMNLLQLGRVLVEAKPRVKHGGWEGWVRAHAHLPVRTAQQYMQAWRTFGEDERIAELGPSQVIRLLPMSEAEREELLASGDVKDMTAREIDQAAREIRERARKEALQEAQAAIQEAERQRDAALVRVEELAAREPEIPEGMREELRHRREEAVAAQKEAHRLVEQGRELLEQMNALRAEKRRLEADAAETEEILQAQQEEINRTKEELLNLKSAQARGEAGHGGGEELTLEAFTQAVREFMGITARLPYMHGVFAGMKTREKGKWGELLRTIEGWTEGARQAMNAVSVEGGDEA